MVSHAAQGDGSRPQFENVAIDAKPEVARQRHEVGGLPRSLAGLDAIADGLRLLLQPLRLQRTKPGANRQSRERGDDGMAGRIVLCSKQFLIVVSDAVGHVEHHLRGRGALAGADHDISNVHDMEHDVVIACVAVMAVDEPVGSLVMDLHIADPERSVDPHLRIEEVGTGMAVVQSHIDHLHRLPVRGGQWGKRKQLVLPDIVEKFFHEAFSVCLYRGAPMAGASPSSSSISIAAPCAPCRHSCGRHRPVPRAAH